MANAHITMLLKAREELVRERRETADRMVSSKSVASLQMPDFINIQSGIEAIDRAIKGEEEQAEKQLIRQPVPAQKPIRSGDRFADEDRD